MLNDVMSKPLLLNPYLYTLSIFTLCKSIVYYRLCKSRLVKIGSGFLNLSDIDLRFDQLHQNSANDDSSNKGRSIPMVYPLSSALC